MQSYFQFLVAARTWRAISTAFIVDPETILMGTRCSLEATLTCVPPMSTTSTFFMAKGYSLPMKGGQRCIRIIPRRRLQDPAAIGTTRNIWCGVDYKSLGSAFLPFSSFAKFHGLFKITP